MAVIADFDPVDLPPWTPDPPPLPPGVAAGFREEDHPRRRRGEQGGGQFTRKPGTRRAQAQGELDYSSLLDRDFPYDQIRTGGGQDEALAALARLRGFDGPPDVVSDAELDARVAAGERELWRGFNGINGGDETQTEGFARQFLTGPYFAGAGTEGNGTYVAWADTADAVAEVEREWRGAPKDPATGEFKDSWVRQSYARGLARAYGRAREYAAGYASSHGTLVRMSLDAGARVIQWADLRARWEAKTAGLGWPPREDVRARREADLFKDPGRYAVILGYDAIETRDGEMNILNRTALHASDRLQDPRRDPQTGHPAGVPAFPPATFPPLPAKKKAAP